MRGHETFEVEKHDWIFASRVASRLEGRDE